MRRVPSSIDVGCAALLAALAGGAMLSSGCASQATDDVGAGGTGGLGSSSVTAATDAASSSTGESTTACAPTEGKTIGETCGVFVAPGGKGDGTMASPFGSIAEAVAAAGSVGPKPIYVCRGTYAESVVAPAGSQIYGGLDCDHGWPWDLAPLLANRSIVAAPADAVPLAIASGSLPTTVFGFVLQAADASKVSGSSIATIVDGAAVSFEHVSFEAGNAVKGQDQSVQPNGAMGSPGIDGATHPGPPATCTTPTPGYFGGATNANAACAATVGGSGGAGGPGGAIGGIGHTDGNGGDGAAGLPAASGGTAGARSSCNQFLCYSCTDGGDGSPGADGGPGSGGSGIGTISVDGYLGASGTAGDDGAPGGGGGGGGGARSLGMQCWGAPGGGSGGSGGCGGPGGLGGGFGGSSIAIVSLGATVAFTDCHALVKNGGAGGSGGLGSEGGFGNIGGAAGESGACAGGNGAAGGAGGPGGGGAGGHAIAVAYTGNPPGTTGLDVEPILPAQAGVGGSGAGAASAGSPGVAAPLLPFE